MSFSKAKITRFNEESSCAPAPGTYNTRDTTFKTVINTTLTKRKIEATLSEDLAKCTPSKQQTIRSYSLPVFRTPSTKRGMKNRSISQSLIVDKEDKSPEKLIIAASDENKEHSCQENCHDSQSRCIQCSPKEKVNFTSIEIMEFIRQISELKYKLMMSKIAEEDLKKELERTNKYNQNDPCLIKEITEKMRKEREEHKTYIHSLQNQVQRVLNEKEDLKAAIDAMKSAFIIINDKYLSLEKDLNSKKKEKLNMANEITELKTKAANISFCTVDIKCTSCGIINKYDMAASNLESIINEISTFFKIMENEFYSLKTQYCEYMESSINLIYCSFTEEIKNMENQISRALSQLNEYAAMTCFTLEEFVKQYDIMCDLLLKSECERIDLQMSCEGSQTLAMEVQNENLELQKSLKRAEVRINNYKIANDGLYSTIRALSKRLFENGEEIEKLNLVIKNNNMNINSVEQITSKFLNEDMFKLLDCSENLRKELNNCLSYVRSMLPVFPPDPSHKTDTFNNLLSKLVKLLNISTTANEMFAYIQMENHSLKLQLSDMAENLTKSEEQKAQKDVKLTEYAQKLHDQAEIIEQQSNSIISMQVLLNHQHENMEQMHLLLQMHSENGENVVSLEEKIADKNNEYSYLKIAYDDLLNKHNLLVESNQKKVKSENNDSNKHEKDLKSYVQSLEEKLRKHNQCLKQERERNHHLESEIKVLKKTISLHNEDKENEQNNIYKNSSKSEDYKAKKERKHGSPNPRTFNNSKKYFKSNSPKLNQSPILKDRNVI